MKADWIKLFLRLALGTAFISAVADRFGFWPAAVSTWGNFDIFLEYTRLLAPWLPKTVLSPFGWLISLLELLLGLCLILGIRTRLAGVISGFLLLTFAASMSLTTGLKGALDYSVFTASAAALALALIPGRFLELEAVWAKQADRN